MFKDPTPKKVGFLFGYLKTFLYICFMNKKIVIMVTGSHRKSENHIECEQTWIPKLREMGFDVFVALGNVDVENYGHLTLNDFKNYYEFINEHTIQFRTFDSKVGLFDKSIKLPIQWILENTNYEYYFRIDSDSFVHPERFVNMLHENFRDFPDVDYMGCCHPWDSWNPHEKFRTSICKVGHIASGCGYMISRKVMKIALDKMRVLQPFEFEADDWVLGRAMWENRIPLLHDSRIYFESKHKNLIRDWNNIGIPDIANSDSHLAIQHYMNGHMKEAMNKLKL
jgi:hypothetical protein